MENIKRDNAKIVLVKAIGTSLLQENQKHVWYDCIDVMTDDDVNAILSAVKDNPSALSFLTENMGEKLAAARNEDALEWQKILAKEKAYLGIFA